jgi:hypothetical protein
MRLEGAAVRHIDRHQRTRGVRRTQEARKYFFFEKKKQKTFICCVQNPCSMGSLDDARNRQKFFGSFFQKRTAFFAFPLALLRVAYGTILNTVPAAVPP